MLDSRSPLYRAARFLSAVGHPLATSAFMIGATCFRFLDRSTAIGLLGMLVLCVIGPITWWNLRGVQKGRYSDFDISRRQDRETMYPIIVLLPLLGSGILWASDQPKVLYAGMLSASLMGLVAFLVNRRIKISLHAAFCFFFAVGSAALAWAWVAPLTIFAVLVTASRWIVGRHVWRELMLGALLGSAVGSSLLRVLGVV